MKFRFWALCLLLAAGSVGCGDDDTTAVDSGMDAASSDGGTEDAEVPDSDTLDADALDADSLDAETSDADTPDVGEDGAVEDAASDGGGSGGDLPTENGPFATEEMESTVARDGRSTPVVAISPVGVAAPPLVVFAPGFTVNSRHYAALCQRVASHGFRVVRADPSGNAFNVSHVAMAADLEAVVGWADATFGEHASVGAMGHSLGGKLSVMLAGNLDRIDAVFAIDPVNGGSPLLGYTADLPDIVPEVTSTLDIPLGFLGETTNGSGFMACAPTDQNFQTFYEGATLTSWRASWDALGADHFDFLSDPSGCTTCGLCPAGSADVDGVRDGTMTLAVSFFRAHLLSDDAVEEYLVGANVPSGFNVTH